MAIGVTRYGIGEKIIAIIVSYLIVATISKPAALLMIIGYISYLLISDYNVRQTWSKQGVKSLSSVPVFGTLFHLKGGVLPHDEKCVKEFGKVFGGYVMHYPQLLLADPELIKQVTVKDFHNFTNRLTMRPKDYEYDELSMFDQVVTVTNDDHWRLIRNTVTPAFTSGKMKQMFPATIHAVNTLNEVLGEIAEKGDDFDVKKVYGAFTMDVITSVVFGTQTNAQRNPNDLLVEKASKLFSSFKLMSLRVLFMIRFMAKYLNVKVISGEVENFFGPLLGGLIRDRKASPRKIPDFLQVMLDSNKGNVSADSSSYDVLPGGGSGADFSMEKSSKRRGLTDFEIKSQALIFLLAGFDTTASTLTFACYALATNPEVQQRAIDEIKEAFPDENMDLDYDSVLHKLPYLEAVIFEALRMYPPAVRFDRVSRSDYDLNGIKIPAGGSISVLPYAVHHDPEIYPEPELFRPERFLGEERNSRPPHVFLPFGFGPRNCIGMRFALMELKLALAQTLRRFKFAPTETTEVPITLDSTTLLKPKETLYLKVVKQ